MEKVTKTKKVTKKGTVLVRSTWYIPEGVCQGRYCLLYEVSLDTKRARLAEVEKVEEDGVMKIFPISFLRAIFFHWRWDALKKIHSDLQCCEWIADIDPERVIDLTYLETIILRSTIEHYEQVGYPARYGVIYLTPDGKIMDDDARYTYIWMGEDVLASTYGEYKKAYIDGRLVYDIPLRYLDRQSTIQECIARLVVKEGPLA